MDIQSIVFVLKGYYYIIHSLAQPPHYGLTSNTFWKSNKETGHMFVSAHPYARAPCTKIVVSFV